MKFSFCSETFGELPAGEVVRRIAAAGYDGIEVAPSLLGGDVTRVSAAARAAFRAEVQRHGLEVSGIHWVLAGHAGLQLTSPDAGVRARTTDYLCAAVDFCADIGAGHVVFGSPKQRSVLPGVAPADAWRWAHDALAPMIARAEQRGVVFCVEPLAPNVTNFLNTAAGAARFAAEFNSPAARVILDVFAMSSETDAAADIIRRTGAQLGYFHANDTNGHGPGRGAADYPGLVRALREIGYDGWVSVEVFDFSAGADVIAAESLRFLRSAFGVSA